MFARQNGISINRFIASAVAEKISALMTEKCLSGRAKAGNEGDFHNALSKISATDSSEQDVL